MYGGGFLLNPYKTYIQTYKFYSIVHYIHEYSSIHCSVQFKENSKASTLSSPKHPEVSVGTTRT